MYFSVTFILFPKLIAWTVVTIFDSWNVIVSPKTNLVSVKYATSTFSASTLVINWAAAPLSDPIILSPSIVLVFRERPYIVVILSKVGLLLSLDSNIDTTFTTSGVFKDISLSSILNP